MKGPEVPDDVEVLFVHCRRCIGAGNEDKIAVLILDGEVLVVACENHGTPEKVCSVTIPEIERPLL